MSRLQPFRTVCANCDSIAVSIDCSEGAPASTPVKCANCGHSRGTLGDLRKIARLPRADQTAGIELLQ